MNGREDLESGIDDSPNQQRDFQDQSRRVYENNRKDVAIRSLADALGKIASRIRAKDRDDPILDSKQTLNEAAGVIMELANKYHGTEVTKPILVTFIRK